LDSQKDAEIFGTSPLLLEVCKVFYKDSQTFVQDICTSWLEKISSGYGNKSRKKHLKNWRRDSY